MRRGTVWVAVLLISIPLVVLSCFRAEVSWNPSRNGPSGPLSFISFQPLSGVRGTKLTVLGTGFDSNTTVTVGGQACAIVSATDTQIQCTLGAADPGDLSV